MHTQAEESDIYLYFDSIQRNVASYMNTGPIFAAIAEEKREINRLNENLKELKKQRKEAEVEYFNYGGTSDSFNSDRDTNLIVAYGKAGDDVKRYKDLIDQSNKTLDLVVAALDLFLTCIYGESSLYPKFNNILRKAYNHPIHYSYFS